jgi:hypothetical protein
LQEGPKLLGHHVHKAINTYPWGAIGPKTYELNCMNRLLEAYLHLENCRALPCLQLLVWARVPFGIGNPHIEGRKVGVDET